MDVGSGGSKRHRYIAGPVATRQRSDHPISIDGAHAVHENDVSVCRRIRDHEPIDQSTLVECSDYRTGPICELMHPHFLTRIIKSGSFLPVFGAHEADAVDLSRSRFLDLENPSVGEREGDGSDEPGQTLPIDDVGVVERYRVDDSNEPACVKSDELSLCRTCASDDDGHTQNDTLDHAKSYAERPRSGNMHLARPL